MSPSSRRAEPSTERSRYEFDQGHLAPGLVPGRARPPAYRGLDLLVLLIRKLVPLVSLLSGLVLVAAAGGTQPGENGRIVFERLRFQNSPISGDLFTMNPDGTDAKRLTHPPNGTEDTHPDWSPDGRRVVFARQPPKGAYSIWIINADGGHLHRISPPCAPGREIPVCPADDSWAVWSPDGTHLAFNRLTGPIRPKSPTINNDTAIYKDEIVITDRNGRHARTVVWLGPYRGDPQAPAWSPNGKRLVFVGKFMTSKTNGSGCECRRLYVINADGTGMHPITRPGLRPGGRPDWSPDGTKILFRTHPTDDSSGVNSDLYTVHPDGTGLHRVTHYGQAGERVIEGSYSPDGHFIVFETSHGAVGSSLPDVFITSAGTGQKQVTRTKNFEDDADWGPKP